MSTSVRQSTPDGQQIRTWVEQLLRVPRTDFGGKLLEDELEVLRIDSERMDAAEQLMATCAGEHVPAILSAAGRNGIKSEHGLKLLNLLLLRLAPNNPHPVLTDFSRGEVSKVSNAVIGRIGETAMATLIEMLGASRDQVICAACGLQAVAKAGCSRDALAAAVPALHVALWREDYADEELWDHVGEALWAIGGDVSREFVQGRAG